MKPRSVFFYWLVYRPTLTRNVLWLFNQQEKLGRFCPHMVQLLSEWMETFPYDFRDERVMQHVRQLTQRCVALDPSLRRDVSQMLHNLLHRLTALEKYEEFLEKINTEASAALIDTLNVVCNPSPVSH